MSLSTDQFQAKLNTSKKEGFRKWMQQPMARAIISTIPPCENLEIILEACFDAGHVEGSAVTALSFIETIMSKGPR